MMDMHRCIGCRYCMAACPFGARSFNWRDPRERTERDADGKPSRTIRPAPRGRGEVHFCAERIRGGGRPACVEAVEQVPGVEGALPSGMSATPTPRPAGSAATEHGLRRDGLGTGPNVFYILLHGSLPCR